MDFSFSRLAGADASLNRAELDAGLRRMAGADGAFDRGEFLATFGKLGVSEETAGSIFDNVASGGSLSVDTLTDTWLGFAGADGELSEREFEAGIESLAADAEEICFDTAAGADEIMNRGEFRAIANRAGITDEAAIDDVFDRVAGADGEMSSAEFGNEENGFGSTKLSPEAFRERFDALASPRDIDFGRDAGADEVMDRDEFRAIADRAGITDQAAIDDVFDRLAGADERLNLDEFTNEENGFGRTTMSTETFAERFGELARGGAFDFSAVAGADEVVTFDEFQAGLRDLGIGGLSSRTVESFFQRLAGADMRMNAAEARSIDGLSRSQLEDMIRG
ncbi:hypothetical protein [Salinarimonas chemoclinalis]|uniref:hypothetical protein n=1 Tax=Salinarimonas chemoclinalis TaxID=3241599 RepID=UPI003558F446